MQQQLQKTLTSPADAAGFLQGSRDSGASSKDSSCDTDDFVMVPAQFPGQGAAMCTCACGCRLVSTHGPSEWASGSFTPGQLGHSPSLVLAVVSGWSVGQVMPSTPLALQPPSPSTLSRLCLRIESTPSRAPAPSDGAATHSVFAERRCSDLWGGYGLPKPCLGPHSAHDTGLYHFLSLLLASPRPLGLGCVGAGPGVH